MDSAHPSNNPLKLLTLQEAANLLAVSVDVLLNWNEHHILKPTITQNGQIGYTEGQINQFLQIQQSLRAARLTVQKAAIQPSKPQESLSRYTEEVHASFSDALPGYPEVKTHASSHLQHKSSLIFFSSIATVSAILVIAVLAQQGQLAQSKVLGTQTSNLSVALPAISGIPEQSKNDVGLNKNLHNVPDSVFAKTYTTTSNQQSQAPTASTSAGQPTTAMIKQQLAKKTGTTAQTVGNNTAPDGTNISETSTTYANVAVQATSEDITGKAPQTDVLAMNVSGVGIINTSENTNPENNDSRNQLILVILSISGVIVFLMRKPRKVLVSSHVEAKTSQPSEKLLEIDQKMDGTVILYFQGKDYKVSKPELHSDSDRFIERLMDIVGPGVKEIEYDNFTDERMRLSTPLSRLVTRLGFVGIKRDLFFPRTSKHNVLFRKYITRDDLTAMHLTVDQISADLAQVI